MPAPVQMKVVKTEIHVDAVDVSGVTGHRSVTAHVVETLIDGSEVVGPVEVHGVDPLAMRRLHGDHEGNVDDWLTKTVKASMLERHAVRQMVHTKLFEKVGKRL